MKNFMFMLALMVGLFSSCEKQNIINVDVPGCGKDSTHVEYARCYFSASNSNIELTPTKGLSADERRVITCYFPTANGEKVISILEGDEFSVELPRFVNSAAYFVYADGQHIDIYNKLEPKNENVFDAQWEGMPSETPQHIELKRSVGKVTIIKGDIPSGYSITIQKGDGVKYFDWSKNLYSALSTIKHYTANVDIESYYSFPSEIDASVSILLLDRTGNILLYKNVDFVIKRNVNVNITVNANTHGNGGFNVTIDDTPMVDEDINVDM